MLRNKTTTDSPFHCIGLTGGVGAGKTTVAGMLRAEGVTVIDMDSLGREITEQDPEVARYFRETFGEAVFTDGKPDRAKLRKLVFGQIQSRKDLEAFLHPRIRARFDSDAREAAHQGKRLVICEAALLVESGRYQTMEGLIVVLASEANRLARTTARDGISEALARQISAAQVDDIVRRKAATHVITNDGTLAQLREQVEKVLESWRKLGWLAR